jgi:hypothetical protein
VGHEGTVGHVADPALVGGVGLVPPDRAPVPVQLAPGQAAPPELLGERALRDPHAVARPDDLGDVGGAAGRDLEAQADRLIEQGRVDPGAALVAAGLVAQAREAVRPVPGATRHGTDPARDDAPHAAAGHACCPQLDRASVTLSIRREAHLTQDTAPVEAAGAAVLPS